MRSIEKSLTVIKISIATFRSQNEEPASYAINDNGRCAKPPNERITHQVDLTMVFYPKVLRNM